MSDLPSYGVIRPSAADDANPQSQTLGLGIGAAVVDTPATVLVAMPIVAMIGVRVARVYIQTFLGLLAADGAGVIDLAPAGEAWGHIWRVGVISLAPSFVSLLQNTLEFLTRIDVKSPALRA